MPKVGTRPVKPAQDVPSGPFYRLYHGDSREILPTLKDMSIDFVCTDPPYGHSNNDGDLIHAIEMAAPARRKKGDDGSQVYEARPIANDKGDEADNLVQFLFKESGRLLVPGGCCCCCCCGGGGSTSRAGNVHEPSYAWWSIWMDQHLDFKQMVVWDKGPIGMGWHYRRSYEVMLVGQQPGAACKWYADRSDVENILRPGGRCKKLIPSSDDHPTPKPVALAEHFLRLHTQQGDMVLDPFMGHGWVGQACKRLGRSFIGIELDDGFFAEAHKNVDRASLLEGNVDTIREPTYESLFDDDTDTLWRK